VKTLDSPYSRRNVFLAGSAMSGGIEVKAKPICEMHLRGYRTFRMPPERRKKSQKTAATQMTFQESKPEKPGRDKAVIFDSPSSKFSISAAFDHHPQ
jgi:hypothetical protein